MLASVVAAFIYLRIAVALFQPADETDPAQAAMITATSRPVDVWSALVLIAAAGMTFVVGIIPGTFIHFAKDATLLL